MLEVAEGIPEHVLGELRARLNATVAGRCLADLTEPLDQVAKAFAVGDQEFVTQVVRAVEDTLAETTEERIVMAGTANLARAGTDLSLIHISEPTRLGMISYAV